MYASATADNGPSVGRGRLDAEAAAAIGAFVQAGTAAHAARSYASRTRIAQMSRSFKGAL